MSWECGLWGPFIARRPCPQRVPVACMGFILMHCLNIFLSRFGPRAGRALFLSLECSNPNLSVLYNDVMLAKNTKPLHLLISVPRNAHARNNNNGHHRP
ncbi:hypothetical protein BD410DRAFT_299204 [Rickenella mellea]|uniref:Uncharacterized protein n=1 Tax=Rickenella mellea TaxID=50990 RepID=A0A4Y7Q0Y7_9AGAM|nr:hypothetical protein BD410DRAFT_299204 [Rickenella mellea]